MPKRKPVSPADVEDEEIPRETKKAKLADPEPLEICVSYTPSHSGDDPFFLEILQRIFDFLPLKLRLTLSLVSKEWRSAAADELFWSRRVPLMIFPKAVHKAHSVSWFQQFCKIASDLCDHCELRDGFTFEWTRQKLCAECRDLKTFQLVTKTVALKKYRLKEESLGGIFFVGYGNPHGKRAAPMRLFLRSDVRKRALAVHGSKEARLELLRKSKERGEKIKRGRLAKKNNRTAELLTALHARGLTLRSDSSLCAGYIDGTVKDRNVDEISEVMEKHRVLYEQLNCHRRFGDWLHQCDGFDQCREFGISVPQAREDFKDDLYDAHVAGKLSSFRFTL